MNEKKDEIKKPIRKNISSTLDKHIEIYAATAEIAKKEKKIPKTLKSITLGVSEYSGIKNQLKDGKYRNIQIFESPTKTQIYFDVA